MNGLEDSPLELGITDGVEVLAGEDEIYSLSIESLIYEFIFNSHTRFLS